MASVKNPTLKEKATEKPVSDDTKRPKNPPANVLPSEGYVLEIDGKFKSKYETSAAAMKSALELKKKYPQIQINIYGAKERTRTRVVLSV
jgi:hypothetical protein